MTEHRRRGPQGAYGIMCDVESHPFELDTMLFMDWRDEHTEGYPEMREANRWVRGGPHSSPGAIS